MPALDEMVNKDIEARLIRYLVGKGYGSPEYIASGGSAAVYKVSGPHGIRVFKGFDPVLLQGENGAAERKRLEVQRSTIGHNCDSLVQTYSVDEAEGTAFMEMEFIDWPSMMKCVGEIPDERVAQLIMQLVSAVKFLEQKNIVHRDIKPENIHISPDFSRLKLLDLGVARPIDFEGGLDSESAVTDHGPKRPFLATAQYSSPEYLFRLDAPSQSLWRGLSIYQVGAVLHDMIMKKPLFGDEMELGNRWLVAKAVLTKTPSFVEIGSNRLTKLKALAARCLIKDLATRTALVGWEDFELEGASDPKIALKALLSKGVLTAGEKFKDAALSRLRFDRGEFVKRLLSGVRDELTDICESRLPFTSTQSDDNNGNSLKFVFSAKPNFAIECSLRINWLSELQESTANLTLEARLLFDGVAPDYPKNSDVLVACLTIQANEQEGILLTTTALAAAAMRGLEYIEAMDNCSNAGRIIEINLKGDGNA